MNDNKRDFKGVWIPKEIYLDPDLSWTEKIFLIELHSLDQGKGCWASNEYFAKFLNVKEGSVSNMLTKLRKEGRIIDRFFNGRQRYISVNMKAGFIKILRQGSQKYEGRVHKNMNEKNEDYQKEDSVEPQKDVYTELNNTVNNTYNNNSEVETSHLPSFDEWVTKKGYIPMTARIDDDPDAMVFRHPRRSTPYLHEEVLAEFERETAFSSHKRQKRAETVTKLSTEIIKILKDKQGISVLDGGDSHKNAQEFIKKFKNHLEKDKGLTDLDDERVIVNFKGFLGSVETKSDFHWKNMTSIGYLNRNFNKIIRSLV